jgi:Fur family transcriptional regulator, ferric uptake regulator
MTAGDSQRRTRQREVILEELRKVTSHPTAAALHAMVSRRLPRISLATVYRNLERMAARGEIQKFQFGGTEARFDATVAPHDHVRCIECGRLDDAEGPPLELPPRAGEDWRGYEILGHQLHYLGRCPDCRSKPCPNPNPT